jgi:hypothetical protein
VDSSVLGGFRSKFFIVEPFGVPTGQLSFTGVRHGDRVTGIVRAAVPFAGGAIVTFSGMEGVIMLPGVEQEVC